MSNSFYENTLLREEFKLVQALQQNAEFAQYVTVCYEDRITGEEQPVVTDINGKRFPETYVVYYKMPVYNSQKRLDNSWHGTVRIILSEPVLMNKHSKHPPTVYFKSNFEPFNNHVTKTSICTGNAWAVAKDNGLWHFIISLGGLINQDGFVNAEGRHFNGDAYDHWVSRGRKPVTHIKWPLDLVSQLENKLTITPKKKDETKSLNIKKKTTTDNPGINIKPKAKSAPPPLNITKRN